VIAQTIGGVCRLVAGAPAGFSCERNSAAPCVYFANHASHLDFVMIWSALPANIRRRTRPVARRDYWTRTPVRRFMSGHVFHALLIDRGGSAGPPAARATLSAMGDAIDEGDSLIVFPEGTRSLDGTIGPFKSGIYHLSRLRPAIDLVPVLLENTNRILAKGQLLPTPGHCRITFGAPLHAGTGEDKAQFLARARGALVSLGGCDGRRH
jgi:1-acyl-sn-glycerol-3-phosphate acyltransferase